MTHLTASTASLPERDLLVSAVETNDHHGVGILLQRFFPDSREFACLRTTSMYNGQEPFGSAHHELPSRRLTASETERRLVEILSQIRVRRILCVPYYRAEFLHGVLAKRLTGAPMVTYLMDDQNIFAPQVPDLWVDKLLASSDLRLGISQEMCAAYEKKFGYHFDLVPPVVDPCHQRVPCYWIREKAAPLQCAMIGNVWTNRRLVQLRALLRSTGIHVDWYGNGSSAGWLEGTMEEWERDNLHCIGFLPEEDLAAALGSYPFILVPSGTADADDDNPAFSRLSMPSRLVFIHTRTDTPVLVLGSPKTAVGAFVTRLGTGLCTSYDETDFRSRSSTLLAPAVREPMQERIRRIAPKLTIERGGEWIWRSLATRTPPPVPFMEIFPPMTDARHREVTDEIERCLPQSDREASARPAGSSAELFFGYSRKRLVPALLASPFLAGKDVEDVEVTEFLRAAALQQVLAASPPKSDVLFLGEDIPDQWQTALSGLHLWRIAGFQQWCAAAGSASPFSIEPAFPSVPARALPSRFQSIVSAGAQVPSDLEAMIRVEELLREVTTPGGWNFHYFTAVAHPDYLWVPPLHSHLRARFVPRAYWPTLEDMFDDEDAFFMSDKTYDRCWRPNTKKAYRDFGRVCWLNICWCLR